MTILTLTRRAGESIRIGEDVMIHIKKVGKQKVLMQVTAPPEIDIWRRELCDTQEGPSEDTRIRKQVIYDRL
jgi:carbon storage regulator CsrA